METTQTKLLKSLQAEGRIVSTKDTKEFSRTLDKLESFKLIVRDKKFSFKPTDRFYKYAQQLIDTQTPIEEFNFQEEKPTVNNTYNNTIHGNVGQLNQGDGYYNIENINIEIIRNALEKLDPQQHKELNETLNKKDNKAIFEKLKSFGSDVLSNVVASIITNPGLFG